MREKCAKCRRVVVMYVERLIELPVPAGSEFAVVWDDFGTIRFYRDIDSVAHTWQPNGEWIADPKQKSCARILFVSMSKTPNVHVTRLRDFRNRVRLQVPIDTTSVRLANTNEVQFIKTNAIWCHDRREWINN